MDRKVSRDERDRVHVMANGDLAIREMQWSDMGNYICSVSNVVGEDQVETFLYPMKVSPFVWNVLKPLINLSVCCLQRSDK